MIDILSLMNIYNLNVDSRIQDQSNRRHIINQH